MARAVRELAEVEFGVGSFGEAAQDYADRTERLADKWGLELEIAEADAQAALESLHGKWWFLGVDVRYKARRTTKRLVRMRELVDGLGKEAEKLPRIYRKHFPEAG